MKHKINCRMLPALFALFLLISCGGGGGSSSSDTAGIADSAGAGGLGVSQGIAVDPYIVGAVFQEVAADGSTVLQRQSSASDQSGLFFFPAPLTEGSTVELKISNRGLHGGAPYGGMLRRNVGTDEGQPVVVSPMTTMLANGATADDLLQALGNAGLSGLTAADLYADPMAGLQDLTSGITDQTLAPLQASMAIDAYMEITGNFSAGANELNDATQSEILRSMVQAQQSMLSVAEFDRVRTALSNDPDITSPITLGDLISTVVQEQQTVIAQMHQDMMMNGAFDQTFADQTIQNAMGQSVAMLKANYLLRVPAPSAPDGASLYGDNCSGCHGQLATSAKAGSTAADIQAAIDANLGGMGRFSTLTAAEVLAIADALPAASGNPPTPADGVALYGDNCSGCHGQLATSSKAGRTAADIQAAIDANLGGMGMFSSLTAAEVQAIADALPAPPNNPDTPPDGVALYNSECSGCHGPLATSAKAGSTAADIQAGIDANMGGMGTFSTLTAAEIQAIADALPAAPSNPPAAPDGVALYNDNCSGCHGALATSAKAGSTATDIQAAIDANIGGMGMFSSLTAAEIQAIADVLPAASGGTPDYSDCTACHGQPPSGNTYPDTAGAHAIHVALPSINNNCSVCHDGAAHNSQVDVAIQASFDAKSGAAVYNGDGSCSNIICHGGQTTPVWWSGTINVETQCSSCHASGTSQYNGYYSGQHSRHISRGYACTVCHNSAKLQSGHFTNLATSAFEQSAASTIGGGSTSVGSYANGTCSSVVCHSSRSW